MKSIYTICFIALVSSSMLVSMPAFGGSDNNVRDGYPAIVKVYGQPVGIESNYRQIMGTDTKGCHIQYGVLPGNRAIIFKGTNFRIKVFGDHDIIVLCNGEKGITISRK